MTYLELCQQLRQEASDVGTGPTAVTNQVGLLGRIVSWVESAYTEIQNRHATEPSWRWLRHGFTVATTDGDDSYAYGDCTDSTTSLAITRFSTWHTKDVYNPPTVYLTSSGVGTQTRMTFLSWEDFRYIYRVGTQNTGYPIHISEDPQQNLVLGPIPNGIYTITGEYIRSAQVLAADSDVPEMPTQFHMAIVYKAMIKYGFREFAPEIIQTAKEDLRILTRQLEINQLPSIRIGGPLA